MDDFDLTHLVSRTIAERTEWDLDELVAAVNARTRQRELKAAYRQALPAFVRVQLGHTPRPDYTAHDGQIPPVGFGEVPTSSSQNTPDAHRRVAGAGGNLANSRAALLRRAGLRTRIHVADGLWRHIDQCTAADLLYAAAECDRMSELNAAAADRYRRLAKALTERDAERVVDLPAAVLAKVFTNA